MMYTVPTPLRLYVVGCAKYSNFCAANWTAVGVLSPFTFMGLLYDAFLGFQTLYSFSVPIIIVLYAWMFRLTDSSGPYGICVQ